VARSKAGRQDAPAARKRRRFMPALRGLRRAEAPGGLAGGVAPSPRVHFPASRPFVKRAVTDGVHRPSADPREGVRRPPSERGGTEACTEFGPQRSVSHRLCPYRRPQSARPKGLIPCKVQAYQRAHSCGCIYRRCSSVVTLNSNAPRGSAVERRARFTSSCFHQFFTGYRRPVGRNQLLANDMRCEN